VSPLWVLLVVFVVFWQVMPTKSVVLGCSLRSPELTTIHREAVDESQPASLSRTPTTEADNDRKNDRPRLPPRSAVFAIAPAKIGGKAVRKQHLQTTRHPQPIRGTRGTATRHEQQEQHRQTAPTTQTP